MDLWTYQRYTRPRLCVDTVEHMPGGRVIRLRSGEHVHSLALDSAPAAEQVAAELKSLGDPNAPLWDALRSDSGDSAWHALATFLDARSLIVDEGGDAEGELKRQVSRVRGCAERTAEALLAGLDEAVRASVAQHARVLRERLYRGISLAEFQNAETDPFSAEAEPNFFLALAIIECEYLRRTSPVTIDGVSLLLGHLGGLGAAANSVASATELAEVAGLYDEWDLVAHLWLIGTCVVLSTSSEARRFPSGGFKAPTARTGLECMRQIELLTRTTLAAWGENPYLSALNRQGEAHAGLVAGPFIEQYHVTRRFLEILAPLLCTRLAPPLRAMVFRYFGEEFGHEELESSTCETLGVSSQLLGSIVPLPLHFAFVDALTLLADLDPISSFAAVMVIEGVFGEPPKMSLRLIAAARDNAAFRRVAGEHEELNTTLNHNSIPRDLFERVAAVAPIRQLAAVRRILYMLELNHRAWGGIASFYGLHPDLRLHGPFGQRLAPDLRR